MKFLMSVLLCSLLSQLPMYILSMHQYLTDKGYQVHDTGRPGTIVYTKESTILMLKAVGKEPTSGMVVSSDMNGYIEALSVLYIVLQQAAGREPMGWSPDRLREKIQLLLETSAASLETKGKASFRFDGLFVRTALFDGRMATYLRR